MRRAQLSIDTKRKLGKILQFTGLSEEQLEIARQKLCKLSLFEPYAAF